MALSDFETNDNVQYPEVAVTFSLIVSKTYSSAGLEVFSGLAPHCHANYISTTYHTVRVHSQYYTDVGRNKCGK